MGDISRDKNVKNSVNCHKAKRGQNSKKINGIHRTTVNWPRKLKNCVVLHDIQCINTIEAFDKVNKKSKKY